MSIELWQKVEALMTRVEALEHELKKLTAPLPAQDTRMDPLKKTLGLGKR